jgi:hypothetical protein
MNCSDVLRPLLWILLAPLAIFTSLFGALLGLPFILIFLIGVQIEGGFRGFINTINSYIPEPVKRVLFFISYPFFFVCWSLVITVGFPILLIYMVCWRYLQWMLAFVTTSLNLILPFIPVTKYPEPITSF